MDDFNVSSLYESKNEWGTRLLTLLTPLIIEGFKSIFDEAHKLCKENNEMDKYLMTFQNFLSRIPKWNATIIETERNRIIDKSKCTYLEDLVSCIHIIQLKLLTAIRVGQKQKKIDIDIPKLDDFIHKVYIHAARKIYKNTYLFELNTPPLQIQRNNRELEIIVQECILTAVRDSIPVEHILRAYMDETIEDETIEEIKEEIPAPTEEQKQELEKQNSSVIAEVQEKEKEVVPITNIKFNDVDTAMSHSGEEETVRAPKTIERLEEISTLRNNQRKEDEDEDESDKLTIGGELDLGALDVQDMNPPSPKGESGAADIDLDLDLGDIEILS